MLLFGIIQLHLEFDVLYREVVRNIFIRQGGGDTNRSLLGSFRNGDGRILIASRANRLLIIVLVVIIHLLNRYRAGIGCGEVHLLVLFHVPHEYEGGVDVEVTQVLGLHRGVGGLVPVEDSVVQFQMSLGIEVAIDQQLMVAAGVLCRDGEGLGMLAAIHLIIYSAGNGLVGLIVIGEVLRRDACGGKASQVGGSILFLTADILLRLFHGRDVLTAYPQESRLVGDILHLSARFLHALCGELGIICSVGEYIASLRQVSSVQLYLCHLSLGSIASRLAGKEEVELGHGALHRNAERSACGGFRFRLIGIYIDACHISGDRQTFIGNACICRLSVSANDKLVREFRLLQGLSCHFLRTEAVSMKFASALGICQDEEIEVFQLRSSRVAGNLHAECI